MADNHRELSLAAANDMLRACGLRRTYTRVHVLQCLSRQSAPITHADVGRELASFGFETSTLFRGLNDLVEAGIVSRLDVGDRVWRFELLVLTGTENSERQNHPHIVCSQCGRVECVAAFGARILDQPLGKWRVDEIVFKGVCETCSTL